MSTTTQEDQIAQAVAQSVDLFPPLSEDTKDAISHLLRTGGQ